MEPGASLPDVSGVAQHHVESPEVSTVAKPAGPLASVEEAFSMAAEATFLLRIKVLSLLAAAWLVMYEACVQPVGHSGRTMKAGAVEVVGWLSKLASFAAMALNAGAKTATAGLNSATFFLAGTKAAAKTTTSASAASSSITSSPASTSTTTPISSITSTSTAISTAAATVTATTPSTATATATATSTTTATSCNGRIAPLSSR